MATFFSEKNPDTPRETNLSKNESEVPILEHLKKNFSHLISWYSDCIFTKWEKEVKVRDLHILCQLLLLDKYDLALTNEELSQFILKYTGQKIMRMYGDYYYVNLFYNADICKRFMHSLGEARYKREFEMCREFVDKDFDDFTSKLSIN